MYSAPPRVATCNAGTFSTESTCGSKLPVTSSRASCGVLNTLESTPASRSVSVGDHVNGPVTKRPVCADATAGDMSAHSAAETKAAQQGVWLRILRKRFGRVVVPLQRPVRTVDQASIRPPRRERAINENFGE